MATRYYTGAAKRVAQVDTVTPGGTIAATDTFSVTINNKTLTFTATTTTVAHVVTGLYNLWVASEEPEFLEVEPTDSTTTLTLTARTPGKPFTVTASVSNVSGGAAPTLTQATGTAASGPEYWNVAANWSSATAPTTGDTAIIEGNYNILYGLDDNSTTLAKMVIRDFSGVIGLPPTNPEGGYPEYRDQYLKVSSTIIDIMQNVTSPRIRINVGTNQTTATVYSSGTSGDPTIKAVTLRGTHASNVVNNLGGEVGTATEAGETATVATFRQGSSASNPVTEIGDGASLTTVVVDSGTLINYADFTNGTANGGTIILVDDPDIGGTLHVREATVVVNGGPIIAKLVLAGGSVLDLSQDARALTITDCTMHAGATVRDPFGRATWTNAIVKSECDFDDLTLEMGHGKSVSFA